MKVLLIINEMKMKYLKCIQLLVKNEAETFVSPIIWEANKKEQKQN